MQLTVPPLGNGPSNVDPDVGPPYADQSHVRPVTVPPSTTASVLKTMLPLASTEPTPTNPRLSKTPRNFSLLMLGLLG